MLRQMFHLLLCEFIHSATCIYIYVKSLFIIFVSMIFFVFKYVCIYVCMSCVYLESVFQFILMGFRGGRQESYIFLICIYFVP